MPRTSKLSIEHAHRIAKSRNGKCLSTEYINANAKMLWECEKGHQWEAPLSSVKNASSWCPDCVKKNVQSK